MESLERKKTFTEMAKALSAEKTGVDAYELEVFTGLKKWRNNYSDQIATLCGSYDDEQFTDEEYDTVYQFLLDTYSKVEDLSINDYVEKTMNALLNGDTSIEKLRDEPNDARWDILF